MKITIPEYTYGGVVLPEWQTTIPDITVDTQSPRYQAMVKMLRRLGADVARAEEEATRRCEDLWAKAWREALQKAITRRAKQYVDSNWGSLDGLDSRQRRAVWWRKRRRSSSIRMDAGASGMKEWLKLWGELAFLGVMLGIIASVVMLCMVLTLKVFGLV